MMMSESDLKKSISRGSLTLKLDMYVVTFTEIRMTCPKIGTDAAMKTLQAYCKEPLVR